MFNFYIKNHEPFGSVTKNCSVHIFSICSPQISSQYHSKEQLCNYEALMFISECLHLY